MYQAPGYSFTASSHFIIKAILRHLRSHFTDMETEAWRAPVTAQDHRLSNTEQGSQPGCPVSFTSVSTVCSSPPGACTGLEDTGLKKEQQLPLSSPPREGQ